MAAKGGGKGGGAAIGGKSSSSGGGLSTGGGVSSGYGVSANSYSMGDGNFGTQSTAQQMQAASTAANMDADRQYSMAGAAQAQSAGLQSAYGGQQNERAKANAKDDFSRQMQMNSAQSKTGKMSQIRQQNADRSMMKEQFQQQQTTSRRQQSHETSMLGMQQAGSERAARESDYRQRTGTDTAAFQDRKHSKDLALLQGSIQKDLAAQQGQLEMAKVASQERLGVLDAQTKLQQSMFGAISGSIGGGGTNYRYW